MRGSATDGRPVLGGCLVAPLTRLGFDELYSPGGPQGATGRTRALWDARSLVPGFALRPRSHRLDLRRVLLMPGEAIHVEGNKGVVLAKRWLEGTGTVFVPIATGVPGHELVLGFPIAGNHVRSFDLYGVYGSKNRLFFAEVKYHRRAPLYAKHYYDFLAKCYCRSLAYDGPSYDFMFITWHPFLVTRWSMLRTGESVFRAIGERQEWLAHNHVINESLCRDIATRLWLIVLSDRSIHLQLPPKIARTVYAKYQARGRNA